MSRAIAWLSEEGGILSGLLSRAGAILLACPFHPPYSVPAPPLTRKRRLCCVQQVWPCGGEFSRCRRLSLGFHRRFVATSSHATPGHSEEGDRRIAWLRAHAHSSTSLFYRTIYSCILQSSTRALYVLRPIKNAPHVCVYSSIEAAGRRRSYFLASFGKQISNSSNS